MKQLDPKILNRTWTIRQAVDQFFSDSASGGTVIPISTVQTWMRKKVFEPKKHGEQRSSSGSSLDIFDLVTLSILRLFFELRIEFKQVALEAVPYSEDEIVPGVRITDLAPPTLVSKETNTELIFDLPPHLDTRERMRWKEAEKHPSRIFQKFFEATAFDCYIGILVTPSEGWPRRIIVFTPTWEHISPHLGIFKLNTSAEVRLNVYDHYEYIKARLKT